MLHGSADWCLETDGVTCLGLQELDVQMLVTSQLKTSLEAQAALNQVGGHG